MANESWNPTLLGGTITFETTADAGTQIWCAIHEGRTLSCKVRDAWPERSGWEVVMRTGVDSSRPHWLRRWLYGEGVRVVDCHRHSQKLVLARPCADEADARSVAQALKRDYVKAGWLACRG